MFQRGPDICVEVKGGILKNTQDRTLLEQVYQTHGIKIVVSEIRMQMHDVTLLPRSDLGFSAFLGY